MTCNRQNWNIGNKSGSSCIFDMFALFFFYLVVCCRVSSCTCDSTNYLLRRLHIVYTDFLRGITYLPKHALHFLHRFLRGITFKQRWRIAQTPQQMCGVFIGVAVFKPLLLLLKSSCCTETTLYVYIYIIYLVSQRLWNYNERIIIIDIEPVNETCFFSRKMPLPWISSGQKRMNARPLTWNNPKNTMRRWGSGSPTWRIIPTSGTKTNHGC